MTLTQNDKLGRYPLPEGWVWCRLQDLVIDPQADIVSGPFGSNLKSSDYVCGAIPVIRTYSATLTWEDLDRADWEYAAKLWADLRTRGRPIDDTDNTDHFAPLGVTVENWRR